MGNAFLGSIIAFLVVPAAAGLARGNPATQPHLAATMSRSVLSVGRLLDAIRRWESRDGKTLSGDGSRSLGPYHIQVGYRHDAWQGVARSPDYLAKVMDENASRATVLRYWRRYAPASLDTLLAGDSTTGQRRAAAEVLARVHNGGPGGPRKPVTRGYWGHLQAVQLTIPTPWPHSWTGDPIARCESVTWRGN